MYKLIIVVIVIISVFMVGQSMATKAITDKCDNTGMFQINDVDYSCDNMDDEF